MNCWRSLLEFSVSTLHVVQPNPGKATNDPRDFVFGNLRWVADHNRDQAMAVALGVECVLDIAHDVPGLNTLRRQQDTHCLGLFKCLSDCCSPVVTRQ